ncbi:WhiB family transcriptional regulator [Streptomyces chiangmaiensis]|uniref:Transcriptional regulator WhiB n=2 Tax=Streptomyces chiangmaiensis TaxID=766497 RepID=A0ABU7FTQ4_9ACTN|nr:WhiB family transcriptional regulator [Streptomyces chiangmaiensis]MED7827213.1 WhiB family transcriptional regulator [Streptomyces chiangmaiensis]
MNWRDDAACRGEDPELFFPISSSGLGSAQIDAAKAVCLRCSVRAQCLDWALGSRVEGIWGGTTERERRAMLRRDAEHLPATREAAA